MAIMNALKLSIVSFLLIIVSVAGKLRIDSQWGGGFHAAIDIPVVRNVTDDQWEMQVKFDQPVAIDAWPVNLKLKSDENSHYTFTNKFYNARLMAGDKLDFGFIVFGSLELTPKNLLYVTFDGHPVDISRA